MIAYTCEQDIKASQLQRKQKRLQGRPLRVGGDANLSSSAAASGERSRDIEANSPGFLSAPLRDAKCVPLLQLSNANKLSGSRGAPDSSFTPECLFCASSSSGHAQFTLRTAVGEKAQTRRRNNNSFLPSLSLSPPSLSLSPSLTLVLPCYWRGPRRGWHSCLFVRSE